MLTSFLSNVTCSYFHAYSLLRHSHSTRYPLRSTMLKCHSVTHIAYTTLDTPEWHSPLTTYIRLYLHRVKDPSFDTRILPTHAPSELSTSRVIPTLLTSLLAHRFTRSTQARCSPNLVLSHFLSCTFSRTFRTNLSTMV